MCKGCMKWRERRKNATQAHAGQANVLLMKGTAWGYSVLNYWIVCNTSTQGRLWKKILWCRRWKLREKMAGQESRTSKLNMRLEFEGLWAELAYLFRECLKLVFWVHVLPNAFHIIPVLNYAVLHRVAYGKEASVLLAKEDKQGSKSTSSCSIWIFHTLIS